ncbi:hypothetical protein [Myceligenerans pegani]|uniref:DUF4393 domain-containing protein n=1 Tax=Myceligenerans pegani TaxID=2776917 RepID=A0ABR9MXN9_9MICO|nr:hypothetical protein [Myceligenerans sp. TRM 65318]MBE1876164.1 hypothetical protein [Myceligenerans sp. TRM 65318]MBE3018435.1 hypothetical protein [Myceligenerans sp. TRM 65318]
MVTDSDDPLRDALPDAIAAGGLALAASGSPIAAFLSGMTPIVTKALGLAMGEWSTAANKRAEALLHETADAMGGEQAMAEAINSNPTRRELTADTVVASAKVRLPSGVRAMGRALAEGLLHDGTPPDVARFTIEALQAIQPIDAAVLDRISQIDGTSPNDMRVAMPHFVPVLPQILARLNREGLIEENPPKNVIASPGGPPNAYRLTLFGRSALDRLHDAGYDGASDALDA